MHHARTNDAGLVIEAVTLPDGVEIKDAFHPDVAASFVSCDNPARRGDMLLDGVVYHRPGGIVKFDIEQKTWVPDEAMIAAIEQQRRYDAAQMASLAMLPQLIAMLSDVAEKLNAREPESPEGVALMRMSASTTSTTGDVVGVLRECLAPLLEHSDQIARIKAVVAQTAEANGRVAEQEQDAEPISDDRQ